jgi:putative transposase
MDDYESLSHTKCHVVFIPKYCRKVFYWELRRHLGDLGEVFRKLALQKESRIEEGHLMLDHVHMMISIPPKYAVSQVIGFIKGKSAIHLARAYGLGEPHISPGLCRGIRLRAEGAGIDLAKIIDGADRFVTYVEKLTSVIGHASLSRLGRSGRPVPRAPVSREPATGATNRLKPHHSPQENP